MAEDTNETNWEQRKLVCNCPYYMKNNVCKHNLALAATLKFATVPMNAKSLPIEPKAKRVRKSLAKQTLLIQYFFFCVTVFINDN